MKPVAPVPQPPHVWRVLCTHLAIPPALARQWWTALAASRWQSCAAVKSAILLAESGSPYVAPETLIHQCVNGERLVTCLEALCTTNALTRRDVNAIEEKILARLNAIGTWH